jgi:surface antigen
MKRAGYAVGLLPLALVLSLHMPAVAQINPFRGTKAPPMAKDDQQQMLDATQRLNQREHPQVGGTENWNTPTSSGTVRLDRIYHAGGMACHAVTYDMVAAPKAPRRTYRLNWCRTPSGEWRIHS